MREVPVATAVSASPAGRTPRRVGAGHALGAQRPRPPDGATAIATRSASRAAVQSDSVTIFGVGVKGQSAAIAVPSLVMLVGRSTHELWGKCHVYRLRLLRMLRIMRL